MPYYSYPTTTHLNIYTWVHQYALISSHLSSPKTIKTHLSTLELLSKIVTLQSPISKVSEKLTIFRPKGCPTYQLYGTTQINKHDYEYDLSSYLIIIIAKCHYFTLITSLVINFHLLNLTKSSKHTNSKTSNACL